MVLGPGFDRDRMRPRDVIKHYGQCLLKHPEGQNVGLIASLTTLR
jgi:DNA-directed RNA polymerase beta subunit